MNCLLNSSSQETMWLNQLYALLGILCLPGAIFVNITNLNNAIRYLLWNKISLWFAPFWEAHRPFFFCIWVGDAQIFFDLWRRWSLLIVIWCGLSMILFSTYLLSTNCIPGGRMVANDKTVKIDSGMLTHIQTHVGMVYKVLRPIHAEIARGMECQKST